MSEFGINEVLQQIRKVSFTEREKGATFERLIKRWFLTNPSYSDLEEVWLWNEFPFRKGFGGKDLGIDLVAKSNLGDYWAIQCKCYDEKAIIDKEMVNSFLATSSRVFEDENGITQKFSNRIWVSTTNHWGANAEETIRNQNPPVNRINLSDLQTSRIDWEKLFKGDYGKKARLKIRDPFPHQSEAINIAEKHYKENDRGKLVMACGTGKTFTSLRLVEKLVGEKGLVLFMVPSIGLLGQSLRNWADDAKKPIQPICICSDSGVAGNNINADENEDSVVDLARPASTDPTKIIDQLKKYKNHDGLIVVFSTYQSIDVVSNAQKAILKDSKGEYGVFDFIVCDEAHRTTGVKLSDKDESNFTKIHDNDIVQGKKRLYMTATPRLYGENVKIKASKNDCILCSMDDEEIYGKEFFRVNFSYAVRNGILTDYKVLVLTVSEDMIPDNIMKDVKNKDVKELNYDDTGKLIGVISGLSKKILGDKGLTWEADPRTMRRALAFTYKIGSPLDAGSSKNIEQVLPLISEKYNETLTEEERKTVVNIKTRHVDGSMGAVVRNDAISWLSEEAEDPQECRVITNVRCLSEGIDVPALDAVLFLSARNSQVDVVQSVGRVMRSFHKGQADEKKYGYIIIPIVVPENTKPEDALNDNKAFSVVWDILNALRSHDDHFNAHVNTIALNKDKGGKVTVGQPGFRGVGQKTKEGDANDETDAVQISNQEIAKELEIRFDEFKGGFFAKLVEKCGERLYWENWAASVGEIAKKYIERINRLVKEGHNKYTDEFNEFVKTLQQNLNPGITPEQCVEMLAQHMITRPIFETLFSDYKFIEHNSISKSMQRMLKNLESESVDEENETLQKFYDSVRTNIGKIDNLEGKQTVIKNLYEKFFKRAFPLTVETLGTVYTPVECVDFIIRSVDYVLKQEFNTALTKDDVHIHDPFTGTGTFITRLLQLGVIKPEDFKRKYMQEIHCNEIVLLAYYIADVNIESVFHELYKGEDYIPFDGICLTDTFQLGELEENSFTDKFFKENSEAVERQRKAKIRVVIGNPPYSVGQRSANDNAQNQHYPKLEKKIAETYANLSTATNKNSLYDSYIKAFRWSTDRIDEKDGGIVAFISNGAWIDGNSQDGFRATLAQDFDKIYVFNLRGNCRTQGELRRKEGDGIFGLGSRTPIAITILVKYPKERHKKDSCEIFYHDIGDYLKREKKLDIIKKFGSVEKIKWETITPNEKYDWINQRDGVFDNLLPLEPEKKFNVKSQSVFTTNSIGVKTNKDLFMFDFSYNGLVGKIQTMIDFYNEERERIHRSENKELKFDPQKIVWTDAFKEAAIKNVVFNFDASKIMISLYRPFFKQQFCYQKELIERTYQQTKNIPIPEAKNLQICVSGIGDSNAFSCLIADTIPVLGIVGGTQCFPLYWYEENNQRQLSLFSDDSDKYICHDAVSDWILKEIRSRFQGARNLTKEDIFYYVYGLLHSPNYRARFADDLRKSLPRIPIIEDVKDFMAFSKAGRDLAELHLNYEDVNPYPDVEIKGLEKAPTDEKAYDYFRIVDKMRFKSKDDKTAITLNANIEVSNIPEKAYEYVVNGKSAIEWIVERYCVSQDKKSGIVNDCNVWAREHEKPRYVLDLLLSVINVSVKTVDIVNALPRLNFEINKI